MLLKLSVFVKIAEQSDGVFLILTWLCNHYEHLLWIVCIGILKKNKQKKQHQLLPSLQSCICHLFVNDDTRAETRLLTLGTSSLLFVFCFEVEGSKCNAFVWTFERVDLINLGGHLFLNSRHQIKVDLLIRWFEVTDGDTQAVIYFIKLVSIKP